MNTVDSPKPVDFDADRIPPLLYEMVRSFTVLADTLNLSQAVRLLGSTRQTVRRHIAQIEEFLGAPMFEVDERRYKLTQRGEEALPEAREFLARGKVWIKGNTRSTGGLLRLSHEIPNGWNFYQQQRPLTQIWDGESEMIKEAFSAWVQSEGRLEHENFQQIRPYVLVYRDSPSGWICIEVGQESFYTSWWGWENARSSIGRPLGNFPGGPEFEAMLDFPFREVQANGGVRLDEVVTQMPRNTAGGELIPLAYKRLLMASRFPDGSFALISAVDRSRHVTISGLDQDAMVGMPEDAIVGF